MPDQNHPTAGQEPDPATNYERAKPEKESPQGTLDQAPPPPQQKQDELARNAQPSSQKKHEA